MEVTVIREFFDLEHDSCPRLVGEVMACTEARAAQLVRMGLAKRCEPIAEPKPKRARKTAPKEA